MEAQWRMLHPYLEETLAFLWLSSLSGVGEKHAVNNSLFVKTDMVLLS